MFKYFFYLAFGFMLSQFFHALIFYKSPGFNNIRAFPDFGIPTKIGIYLSFIIFIFFLILLFRNYFILRNLKYFITFSIIILIISQIFGRSLIKFGFESSFCVIVILSLLFEKYYCFSNFEVFNKETVEFVYKELWELFKLGITFFLFWLGTVGFTFAVQFLGKYFKDGTPVMVQFQMFRYGVSFIYSVIGIVWLIFYPLLNKIFYTRNFILK